MFFGRFEISCLFALVPNTVALKYSGVEVGGESEFERKFVGGG
jgi:hypothetical protein